VTEATLPTFQAMRLLLRSRAFRPVLGEWARRIETGDASGFASWFMEILCDRSHRLSEACRRFSVLMRTGSWREVKEAIPKRLKGARSFRRPAAGRFYGVFRKSVASRIDRHWRDFAGGGRAGPRPGSVDARKPAGPKLRPIEELIRKICKDDHTKGILVR